MYRNRSDIVTASTQIVCENPWQTFNTVDHIAVFRGHTINASCIIEICVTKNKTIIFQSSSIR